jgi:signal transduction histidine kinase
MRAPDTTDGTVLARATGAVDDLARSVRAFDLRLYRALLACRMGLPVLAFATQLEAYETGGQERAGVVVWGVLAIWTTVSLPYAWSRLEQMRRLPPPLRIEIAVLVVLVFLGIGARNWHFLHCFVPLVFVAFFVGAGASRVVAAGMLAALWLADLVSSVAPGLTIGRLGSLDTPIAAVMPTVLVIASTVLLGYVRRVLGDADEVVASQRRLAAAHAEMARAVAHADARAELQTEIAERLRASAQRLVAAAARIDDTQDDGRAVRRLAHAIDDSMRELDPAPAPERPATLAEVARAAVAASAAHGARVTIAGVEGRALEPADVASASRLLTELVTNAIKHGGGPVRVDVAAAAVAVENPARAAPSPRAGGRGLADLETEAALLGATIERSFDGRRVRSTVVFPQPGGDRVAEPEPAAPARSLEIRLQERRDAYVAALLAVRVVVAAATTVLILVKADEHRTLVWPIFATGLGLTAWNVWLLARRRRVSAELRRAPRLALVDAIVIGVALVGEGGMASPWIPLSLGVQLLTGFAAGATEVAAVTLGLGLAQLGGFALFRALPIDDAGTRSQSFPLGFVFNLALYLAVALIGRGIGWMFGRIQEASEAYDETRLELERLTRVRAHADARAETRRSLHATLEQYVAAAQLRLSIWPDGVEGSPAQALRRALREIDRELATIGAELVVPPLAARPAVYPSA